MLRELLVPDVHDVLHDDHAAEEIINVMAVDPKPLAITFLMSMAPLVSITRLLIFFIGHLQEGGLGEELVEILLELLEVSLIAALHPPHTPSSP